MLVLSSKWAAESEGRDLNDGRRSVANGHQFSISTLSLISVLMIDELCEIFYERQANVKFLGRRSCREKCRTTCGDDKSKSSDSPLALADLPALESMGESICDVSLSPSVGGGNEPIESIGLTFLRKSSTG